MDSVRILHISDTHALHRTIEDRFPMPSADILIHTGDFTNKGGNKEWEDFNDWLGDLRARYEHIIVIAGNHEYVEPCEKVKNGEIDPNDVLDPSYMQSRLSNATVLHHSSVVVHGIHIYGSSWVPWHSNSRPENGNSSHDGKNMCWEAYQSSWGGTGSCPSHRFLEIPSNVDILLTHGPAMNVLDCVEGSKFPWGSSELLSAAIMTTRPKVHLFGHLHEQRGKWWRSAESGRYEGGTDYDYPPGSGEPIYTHRPPIDYPCQVISNNAMLNHSKFEGRPRQIAGPARLIVASKKKSASSSSEVADCDVEWDFHTS